MNGKISLSETTATKGINPALAWYFKKTGFLPIAALFIFLASPSCLSVSERLYNVPRQSRQTKAENIMVSYEKPEKKHLIIGELSVRYGAAYKRETAIKYLVDKAAENGADGIILNPIHRVEDKWGMTNHPGDKPTQIEVKIYVLSGSIYQFQK